MNNVSEADPALRKRLQGMEPDVYFKVWCVVVFWYCG